VISSMVHRQVSAKLGDVYSLRLTHLIGHRRYVRDLVPK
jgi:hypothetical protein